MTRESKDRVEMAKKAIKNFVKISNLFKEYSRFSNPAPKGEDVWMIVCPFHSDVNPSLGINDATHQWNCFGCDAKGDAASALVWLARSVDRIFYSYAQAIDQLILRNIKLKESLPFNSVFEDTVLLKDVLKRQRLKFSDTAKTEATMTDVYGFMQTCGRVSFIDIAHAAAMMLNKQTPEQIMAFFNAEKTVQPITLSKGVKSDITAADLLAGLEW